MIYVLRRYDFANEQAVEIEGFGNLDALLTKLRSLIEIDLKNTRLFSSHYSVHVQ